MPKADDGCAGLLRKEYPIFIIVEKSDNINVSKKITDLVCSMKNALLEVQGSIPDVELKVGLYTFSSECYSMHPQKLENIGNINVQKLNDNTTVNLTDVFVRLNNDLSRSTLLTSLNGYALPNIILVLDGTKNYVCDDSLENLNHQNKWYKHARKIAVFVNGQELKNHKLIKKFTGTEEAIISVGDIDATIDILKQFFIRVSVPTTGSICAEHNKSIVDYSIVSVDPIEDDSNDAWGFDNSWDPDQNWD